ncbi:hypothetical protein DFQ30_011208 [Apophysomyces sp. BC1015]|nr:hypothetical protein DFQ30_011208 [Apophysomyces sp. BC1015]KAG0179736.1 hypothetical protein DFQ29_001714 [Apophysomyces sp. BC1021]
MDAKTAPNGYVPCKRHPMPRVLGTKVDFTSDMVRPSMERHLMVCVGEEGAEWTRSKVEAVQDGVVAAIGQFKTEWIREQRKNSSIQTIPDTDKAIFPTVAERPSDHPWPICDVVVFPDFRIYPAVRPDDLRSSSFSKALDTLWRDPTAELPEGAKEMADVDAVVLVCTHTQRDKRCGVMGPLIVNEFRRVLKTKGLLKEGAQGKVEVWGTSHFGGHKFAGNVIIHQKGLGGQIYGNVRECHVESIVNRHIIHRKVIKELWRGPMTPILE